MNETNPRAVHEPDALDVAGALHRFLAREVEIPFDLHADLTTILHAARRHEAHLADREGSR